MHDSEVSDGNPSTNEAHAAYVCILANMHIMTKHGVCMNINEIT